MRAASRHRILGKPRATLGMNIAPDPYRKPNKIIETLSIREGKRKRTEIKSA